MDINEGNVNLKYPEGSPLVLINQATGKPYKKIDGKAPTLFLRSVDSPELQIKDKEIKERRLTEAYKKKENPRLLDSFEEECEKLAVMTVSWHGIMNNGEPVECTYDNAYQLYYNNASAFAQATKFVTDNNNFF